MRAESSAYYSIPVETVKIDASNGKITAELNLASQSDGMAAQKLDLTLNVYQNGILRMLLEEPGHERFRISQEDLPVVEEQLKPADINDKIEWASDRSSVTIKGLMHEQGDESFDYSIEFAHFRIDQLTQGSD